MCHPLAIGIVVAASSIRISFTQATSNSPCGPRRSGVALSASSDDGDLNTGCCRIVKSLMPVAISSDAVKLTGGEQHNSDQGWLVPDPPTWPVFGRGIRGIRRTQYDAAN